jgi:hypothetical protein
MHMSSTIIKARLSFQSGILAVLQMVTIQSLITCVVQKSCESYTTSYPGNASTIIRVHIEPHRSVGVKLGTTALRYCVEYSTAGTTNR